MKQNYESGRSMVEMLGTLAIIGVLSIGGIAGYSYGMDKYRANTIINDVMLRHVDIIAQNMRGGTPNLSEWPTMTVGKYTIGLEEGTTGIQISDLPESICEIVFDGMINNATVKIGTTEYDSATDDDVCGDTNTMVFYVDDAAGSTTEETTTTTTEETTTTTTPAQKFCSVDTECGKDEFCGDKMDTIEYMEPYICKSLKYSESRTSEVMIYVLETPMSWWDTKTACEKLGGRMPTSTECKDSSGDATDFCKEIADHVPDTYWIDCPECGETGFCYKSCGSCGFPWNFIGVCIID